MKISIITPTYNSEKDILRTIKSIKKQNIHNKECFFIDAKSEDNTIKIIKKNIKYKKIVSEKDKGIYDAINKGIKISKDSIVSILHSNDNYYSNNTLKHIIKTFKKYDVNLIFGNLVYRKNNGKILRKWISLSKSKKNKILYKKDFIRLLKQGWMPPHPAVFMKKSLIKSVGKYDLKYSISSDYDYLIRIFKSEELKALYVDKMLISMSWGGKSNQVENIYKKMSQDLNIIKKNNVGGVTTLLMKNISKLKQFF